jgi:hypothetical protein
VDRFAAPSDTKARNTFTLVVLSEAKDPPLSTAKQVLRCAQDDEKFAVHAVDLPRGQVFLSEGALSAPESKDLKTPPPSHNTPSPTSPVGVSSS